MERWSTQHRVFCVEKFIQFNTVIAVQRRFRCHFNVRRCPQRKTILAWRNKWRQLGSIEDKKSSGRPRTACNERNEERVRNAIIASPKKSAVKHASVLGLSDRSTRRLLKRMNFHPYKIAIAQEINGQDKINRLEFCRLIHDNHQGIENNLFMSDEAHFYLTRDVNKQNCRYCAQENPREMRQRPLHCPKVTVWCAISSSRIIGPYFFEENGQTVTVTAARYVQMLQTFFLPQIEEEIGYYWFQQDGATSHTARISMDILRESFPNRLISRNGTIPWPARSPDLSVPDYFLWGYLKFKVFVNKPRNLRDLKLNIRNEINAIPRHVLQNVMQKFTSQIEDCIENNGGHLRNSIFKS